MTELRNRMIADMVSAGLAPSTQAAYIQAVRGLAAYYRRAPDQLTEAEVRSYLLHLRDGRGLAHGTFHPKHSGIQFLFAHTLDREWSLFSKKEFAHQSICAVADVQASGPSGRDHATRLATYFAA